MALVRNEPTVGFLRSSVDPLIKALQPKFQLVDSLAAGAWPAVIPPRHGSILVGSICISPG